MNNTLRNICAAAIVMLCALTSLAEIGSTGYYRFRNYASSSDYITIANDLFNYHIVISTAAGGLQQAYGTEGQLRALECAGKYLQTDIHLIDNNECIFPSSVIYAQKKKASTSDHDYNLIGQGTSLLTLTTGTYDGSIDLEFQDRYITIEKVSGSGATALYTAKIELKSSTFVIFIMGYPNLGMRYFVDDNHKFAISESNSADNAKWYIEPVTYFNVKPEVEFNGKYYTTIKVPYAFVLSDNVDVAYTITNVGNDNIVAYDTIAVNGGTVPAGTPVILECSSNVAAECKLIPSGPPVYQSPDLSVTTQGAPRATDIIEPTSNNLLIGTYYCNTDGSMTFTTNGGTSSFVANHAEAKTNRHYVLGITASGKLGFIQATEAYMPANKAWMLLDNEAEFPWELPVTSTKGDVNHDGKIDVDDVTAAISIVLETEPEDNDYDYDAADFNDDGKIDVDDITGMIAYILEH